MSQRYMNRYRIMAPCTIIIAAINVIIFFILTFQGVTEDGLFLLEHGAMYVPYVMEQGEYYRLFTSLFLHFGFHHLINNMVMLVLIGWTLEAEIGSIRLLLIYLLSGLGGNLLSAWWDILRNVYPISAGASGAVFGVIGALLYIAVCNRGQVGNLSGRRLLLMVVLSLYLGYADGGVDNMAHIGGLVTGFLLSILLYRKRNSKRRAHPGF